MTDEIRFMAAGCGHILTPFSLGGNCSACSKLCCKNCLVVINGEMLCPACFKGKVKG